MSIGVMISVAVALAFIWLVGAWIACGMDGGYDE